MVRHYYVRLDLDTVRPSVRPGHAIKVLEAGCTNKLSIPVKQICPVLGPSLGPEVVARSETMQIYTVVISMVQPCMNVHIDSKKLKVKS